MSDARGSQLLSAQGTKLNKRGIESRRRFIDQAIETLAAEGPAGASANLIAKQAGFTWGTVQHQFGDADGVWAAVIDVMDEVLRDVEVTRPLDDASISRRVNVVIERLWAGWDSPGVRAVENLRLALPRHAETLAAEYPETEAALRRFDQTWQYVWSQLFADLPVSEIRLRRVRSLIPAALRGLRQESDVVGYSDPDEGRRALIDAVVAYLEAVTR